MVLEKNLNYEIANIILKDIIRLNLNIGNTQMLGLLQIINIIEYLVKLTIYFNYI